MRKPAQQHQRQTECNPERLARQKADQHQNQVIGNARQHRDSHADTGIKLAFFHLRIGHPLRQPRQGPTAQIADQPGQKAQGKKCQPDPGALSGIAQGGIVEAGAFEGREIGARFFFQDTFFGFRKRIQPVQHSFFARKTGAVVHNNRQCGEGMVAAVQGEQLLGQYVVVDDHRLGEGRAAVHDAMADRRQVPAFLRLLQPLEQEVQAGLVLGFLAPGELEGDLVLDRKSVV